VQARQAKDYQGQEAVEWTHRDPVGQTESGKDYGAYDPLGNFAAYQNHPPVGAPSNLTGMFGPSYNSIGRFYNDANNLSVGCVSESGAPTDCDSAMRERMGDGWVDNLPQRYQGGGELWRGEQAYQGRVDSVFGLTGFAPLTGNAEYVEVEGRQRLKRQRIRRPVPQPQNPFRNFASPIRLSDEACDKHLSNIFGGYALAMETGGLRSVDSTSRTPHSARARNDLSATERVRDYETGRMKTVRRADRGGIIHAYTDNQGSTRTDVPLFTPSGWIGKPVAYYVNGNSGIRFTYSGGITIEFVHVGTNNKNMTPAIPTDRPDANGLVQIGWIAGPDTGGDSLGYNHTHIVFFSNHAQNERIDPRVLFCGFPAQ